MASANKKKNGADPSKKVDPADLDEHEGEAKAAEAKAGAEKPAEGKSPSKSSSKASKGDEPKAAAKAPHGDHGHDAAHGHAHAPNRKEYWKIFVVLAVLTVLEVGVAQLPGFSKRTIAVGLITLALTKAACVGLFYMHLKSETKVLKATVFLPFAAPAIYALVLISEAAWRFASG